MFANEGARLRTVSSAHYTVNPIVDKPLCLPSNMLRRAHPDLVWLVYNDSHGSPVVVTIPHFAQPHLLAVHETILFPWVSDRINQQRKPKLACPALIFQKNAPSVVWRITSRGRHTINKA